MNTPAKPPSMWERSLTRRLLRWFFCWRTLRRMLLGAAGVATIIALFYAIENWRGSRAWTRLQQEMEAKGEKLDIASLAPPPVPDERNLAMAPVLKPIFDYTRGPDGLQRKDSNAWDRLTGIDIHLRGSEDNRLEVGNLEKLTLADLEAWRRFYRGNTNYPQPGTSGSAARDVLVALGKFGDELRELEAAAAARPDCRFPLNYQEEMPFSILLPHLAIVKKLSRTIQLRAIAELEAGQSQRAFSDLELGFRLSEGVRNEPLLIDHLVRLAILQMNLQVIREGLARQAWSDAQLAALDKRLAGTDVLAEYQHAIRGERALCVESLDYVRRQRWSFDPVVLLDPWDNRPQPCMAQLMRLIPSGWYQQNKVIAARLLQEYTLAAADTGSRRVHPEKSQEADRALQAMRTGPYTFFVRLLVPAVNNATVRSARMQAWVDAARTACALERYRLAHGRYPDRLEDLIPRFLEKTPTDVMDGQPLRYRKTPDDGFAVYSVGWNQTDDGGNPGWIAGRKTPKVNALEGDWVWSQPGRKN